MEQYQNASLHHTPLPQIRTQISREFVQDLQAIAEENAILLRETLSVSLSLDATAAHPLESESDLEASRDEDDRY